MRPPEDHFTYMEDLVAAAKTGFVAAVAKVLREHRAPENTWDHIRRSAYYWTVLRVVDDGEITDSEQEELALVRRALDIAEDVHETALHTYARPMISRLLHEMMADRRVTDVELARFELQLGRMKSRLNLDVIGQRLFDQFIEYARWEAGDLPVITSAVSLQNGELLHAVSEGTWAERDAMNSVRNIGHGAFYFTSKRLLFVGGRGSKTILWHTVISSKGYTDAVEIHRASGPHVYCRVDDGESASVLVSCILGQSQQAES